MKIVHSVQVHPIHAGHINDHKVLLEREFDTKQEAIEYRDWFNRDITDRIAVYQGAINDETGENL